MMNHGAFGQFQRGASCNTAQQRPAASCGSAQQRPAASCSQTPPCPPKPIMPCPPPSCNQPERPVPPCNRPQGQPSHRPVGPSCSCCEMSREQLLLWISQTKFACIDSALYLDTHPWDVEAIAYFQEQVRFYNEALAEYSKTYGPLTLAHAHHCDTYWDWVNQPWPWQ